jgi:hypothetical protein
MLSKTLHRVTTCALVAAWLLASTAAGLWHAHPAGQDHATSCAHAGHGNHHRVGEPRHTSVNHDSGPAVAIHRTASSHDDCVVCRFLAARVLPAAVVHHVASSEQVATLDAAEPIDLSTPLARTTHSRAPPTAG